MYANPLIVVRRNRIDRLLHGCEIPEPGLIDYNGRHDLCIIVRGRDCVFPIYI